MRVYKVIAADGTISRQVFSDPDDSLPGGLQAPGEEDENRSPFADRPRSREGCGERDAHVFP